MNSTMTSTAKFDVGSKVRLTIDGRPRLGVVAEVMSGSKRGLRRMYRVTAQTGGRDFGYFRSNDLSLR